MKQEEELSEQILWLQVWGLAGLQGAIAFTWLIYSVYLPKLLAEFNFPTQLSIVLMVVENGLAVVLEPLMGALSDRDKRQFGSRFPLIIAGVFLASTCFIAIPTVMVFGAVGEWRWILIAVSIAWALAMTVFRSSAISLLRNYAPSEGLALANSLLVLVTGLFAAFQPVARSLILNLGAIFAFALGSFTLLGTTAILRYVNLPETLTRASSTTLAEDKNITNLPLQIALSLIFLIGIAIAWGTQFLTATLSKTLMLQMGIDNVDWLMVGVGIVLALAAPPTADWALRLDDRRAMFIGAIATTILIQIAVFVPNWLTLVVAILGLLVTVNLVLNGAIPFALMLVPPSQAGISTGMYFGGMAGAESILGFFSLPGQSITPAVGAIASAGAFLLLATCVAVSIRWRSLYSA